MNSFVLSSLDDLTLQAKISACLPVQMAQRTTPDQYVRYTPAQQNPELAGGSTQRIIRIVEEQRDPMEPPRFKQGKNFVK